MISNHHHLLEATEEEPVLVDERLHHVLQVWPHCFKFIEVTKLVLKQGWPPADCQIFAVHAVNFTALRNPETIKVNPRSVNKVIKVTYLTKC